MNFNIGATANVKKMILSIFGDAGIYLEKLIRKLNWVYLFQGFPGIFPVLTWKDRFLDPMDSVNSTYEDIPKDMCIPWGKSLVDFFCGTSKEEFTQSIFNGVCSQRMSQIAMRYFLVARVVTSDGKYIYVHLSNYGYIYIDKLMYILMYNFEVEMYKIFSKMYVFNYISL